MELIAVLLSVLVGGGYGQWVANSITTPCESLIDPSVCSGPCEECPTCVSDYVYECKCLPEFFLDDYPDSDPLNICWFFTIRWGITPLCCEYYKQIKRGNEIPLTSDESANSFFGLIPNYSDTNKRANNATTSSTQDDTNTSRVDLNENNNMGSDENQTKESGAGLVETDLTDIDIGESYFDNVGTDTNSGRVTEGADTDRDTDTDIETQDDNRTGTDASKNKETNKKDEEREATEKERNRRDSLLMRALMLTEKLLNAEDLRRGRRQRERFK